MLRRGDRVRVGTALAVLAVVAPAGAARAPGRPEPPAPVATVTVDLERPIGRFVTATALGAGVDGHGAGETAQIYTARNLRAMRSAGLRALTYRLRTELGVEAWHWNPRGRWSDQRRRRGYWTSSSQPPRRPFDVTYGYRLPRRGNTVDQADDNGYSRLDDGDPRTFWKSNPYLDARYAGRSAPAQWVLIDLGHPRRVGALSILWSAPFARRFVVERWIGANANFAVAPLSGRWVPFPESRFAGHPGPQHVRLGARPVTARFLRVLLSDSSHTTAAGSHDVRDRLGFAIRELSIRRGHGSRDLMRHRRDRRQTATYVSSTDPWHRAVDRDPGSEQPSFQRVLASRLIGSQASMVPVALLYGTPPDAAAELRFLRALRYPVGRIELGEEPDGQLAGPETYGALYLQAARALHSVDPRAHLGGPSLQTSTPDWEAWDDGRGSTSWTRQFLAYLRARHASGQLRFFSFEWYPFDDVCAAPAPQLMRAPALLAEVLHRQELDGLRRSVPRVISEYGYSAFAGRAEVDLPGALFDAEAAAQFLTLGGEASYLYGYEPEPLIRESSACNTWGNLALWQSDGEHRIIRPLAALRAMRLVTGRWAQPHGDRQTLYAVTVEGPGTDPPGAVTAYALRRPDGTLAILLINKDPHAARPVRALLRSAHQTRPLHGPADLFELSPAQYVWHARGERGFALPDRPPAHVRIGPGSFRLTLLASSISVLQVRTT